MATLFFQARGPLWLQKILADGSLAAAFSICPDALALDLAEQEWSHPNKCGAVDVEDASGINSVSASIKLAFSNVEDKLFALGALGTINAAGSPGTVSSEDLPGDLADGDGWFLGGKTHHRTITGLTISGMTVNVDYTLDAVTGKVTFIGDQSASPVPTAAYGYTDPQSVALLNAPVYNYMGSMEYINKQAANKKGSLELYKIRFGVASTLDFLSDKAQDMSLVGKALADTDRDADGELGQFGRRVL